VSLILGQTKAVQVVCHSQTRELDPVVLESAQLFGQMGRERICRAPGERLIRLGVMSMQLLDGPYELPAPIRKEQGLAGPAVVSSSYDSALTVPPSTSPCSRECC
jgi:hypothetical protein